MVLFSSNISNDCMAKVVFDALQRSCCPCFSIVQKGTCQRKLKWNVHVKYARIHFYKQIDSQYYVYMICIYMYMHTITWYFICMVLSVCCPWLWKVLFFILSLSLSLSLPSYLPHQSVHADRRGVGGYSRPGRPRWLGTSTVAGCEPGQTCPARRRSEAPASLQTVSIVYISYIPLESLCI